MWLQAHIYVHIFFLFSNSTMNGYWKNLTSWKSSTITLYALGPFWCTGLAHWNVWIFTHVHYLSGKTVEINLANFLLKIQLPQQLTLPWYLPRVQLGLAFVSYFQGSCFLLRHQEVWEGCSARTQSVQTLEKPSSHQGPFWPPRPRAHRYLRSVGLLGKPVLEGLGFSQLQFVGAAGRWLCSPRHSPGRGSCQSQADGAAARAKPCVNMSQNTTCTQCWLQHQPSPGPICSCSNPALTSLSSCIKQVTGLFPLQLGVIPSDLSAAGMGSWHLLGNTNVLFSLLFFPFHVQPNGVAQS